MIDVKKALDELNYNKLRDLINQMIDLRENGHAPERSQKLYRVTLNDELTFLEMNLDINDYLDKIIWISKTEYICYLDHVEGNNAKFISYCEYNPMKEKEITYTVYFIGRCKSELEFTMLLADIFVRKIAIEGSCLRDKIDCEIARIRIIDSIMDLKYSDFDQFAEKIGSGINIYGYKIVKTPFDNIDTYRKIYDYTLQNPTADNNADYHDLLVYIYKNSYGASKTEE